MVCINYLETGWWKGVDVLSLLAAGMLWAKSLVPPQQGLWGLGFTVSPDTTVVFPSFGLILIYFILFCWLPFPLPRTGRRVKRFQEVLERATTGRTCWATLPNFLGDLRVAGRQGLNLWPECVRKRGRTEKRPQWMEGSTCTEREMGERELSPWRSQREGYQRLPWFLPSFAGSFIHSFGTHHVQSMELRAEDTITNEKWHGLCSHGHAFNSELSKLHLVGQIWPASLFGQVLLQHRHAVHFHIVYNRFRATLAELSSWDRAHTAHKASNSLSGLLQKVCQLAFYLWPNKNFYINKKETVTPSQEPSFLIY